MASSPPLRISRLARAPSAAALRVYRSALEWDLEDPIIIDSRDDLLSEQRWKEFVEPYQHQVSNLITFCRRLPVTLLADDVGLGKTISAGLIASELMARGRVGQLLIVCPKLLIPQWAEELRTKFDIESVQASGKKLLDAEPEGKVGAVITTYHSAREYLQRLPEGRFQMLILDEAHKLRNLYGVDPPPQVAQRFRQVLADRMFKYVLMLTATPIQNRLWDLYSLVDLLCVARGHENPFGKEGMFARTFIADERTKARQLKPEARDRFRSIVYGYMSRVRRADANLHFPERIVQLHKVVPSKAELDLITAIAKPIQKMNRLAQISILQALTSSPHALNAQLANMARKGTVPPELAKTVSGIVANMGPSAKLQGLEVLVDQLKVEQAANWRMVIFTGRLETQTTIQEFLERQGLKVGIINGQSGLRNQATIEQFKASPPKLNVIVSTEAGSEGVNLQAANVLVNYDLPWNPMIVEQRIGRIQRLASNYANVCIFNVTLKGTFEEYIVGRLMEKLQMAAQAIGDVDALLDTLSDDDGDDESGFEERIRLLVVDALAGKDISTATRLAEKSIENAKVALATERENIDRLLGGQEGRPSGPATPKLPPIVRQTDAKTFVLEALASLGAAITQSSGGNIQCKWDGRQESITFDASAKDVFGTSTLYAPQAPAFERLVNRVLQQPFHDVSDAATAAGATVESIGLSWAKEFGGTNVDVKISTASIGFSGSALVRVRATVAHDSYERLVEVPCLPPHQMQQMGERALTRVPDEIDGSSLIGLDPQTVSHAACMDPGIVEFCQFYEERRTLELRSAGTDERKRTKLRDEFTPQLDAALVGLEGGVERQVSATVSYTVGDTARYDSRLTIDPGRHVILDQPAFETCAKSGAKLPVDCVAQCAVSSAWVARYLMVESEHSRRLALEENTLLCSVTGKRLLTTEAEVSGLTGQRVAPGVLRKSPISGISAEPSEFELCQFTKSTVLKGELLASEVSGKIYRSDQTAASATSRVSGHRSEFVTTSAGELVLPWESEVCDTTKSVVKKGDLEACSISGKRVVPGELLTSDASGRRALRACFVRERTTGRLLLNDEAETCELTGAVVSRGLLEPCDVSGKRVLAEELERCSVSMKRALHRYFVASSLSGAKVLESQAIISTSGKFCVPAEARKCIWSGKKVHPEDIRTCDVTGEEIHAVFATATPKTVLDPLLKLLVGQRRSNAAAERWESIADLVQQSIGAKKVKIIAAELGPAEGIVAACAEIKGFLKTEYVGFLLNGSQIIGRIGVGRRREGGWTLNQK